MVDWGNVDSVVVLSFLCQLFNDGLCLWHVTGSTNLRKKILYIYISITFSTIQGFIYWIWVISSQVLFLHQFSPSTPTSNRKSCEYWSQGILICLLHHKVPVHGQSNNVSMCLEWGCIRSFHPNNKNKCRARWKG